MKEQTTQLVDFFKVFADETRMEILELLARGEKPTREITDELGKSQSTISQHMKILVNSGLVEFTTDGKKKTYHITTPDIHAVVNAVKSMVTKLSQMNANQVSEDSIYNIGGNAAKILLMGLSNSGKT
ncbi:MAG: ArsR/SmtB family transcription factor, partial [Candidatus Hodarchaeota archaeon]